MIIAPIHCDPKFLSKAIKQKIPYISFHKIVGDLLRSDLEGKFIIEITGNRGKTTTAITLATLLSNEKKILCLSSRGLEIFQNGISKSLNRDIDIAPPYLLQIKQYLQDFDIGIFEVSLGGTGLADIGILTNIIEDYPIAGSTKTASYGKKQILEIAKENSIIFYNNDDKNSKKLIKDTETNAKLISFGETGQIKAKKFILNKFNETKKLEIEYNFFSKNNNRGKLIAPISGKLIGLGYYYAILIYVGVALILEINKNKIIKNLSKLNAISERLSFHKIKKCWILEDINSGVGHLSLNATLDSLNSYLNKNGNKIWLILDFNSSICEKTDIEKIQIIISHWKPLIQEIFSTNSNIGKPYKDLDGTINNICEKSREKDIIFIMKKVKG